MVAACCRLNPSFTQPATKATATALSAVSMASTCASSGTICAGREFEAVERRRNATEGQGRSVELGWRRTNMSRLEGDGGDVPGSPMDGKGQAEAQANAASVQRHHNKALREIKRRESTVTPANTNAMITSESERTRVEGDFKVRSTETHVIKVREDASSQTVNTRLKQLIAGGGSGAITKTAVAPLERVKILLQIQGMKGETSSNPKYVGVWGTTRTVVNEEGFLALYKGNGANVLRVVPVYALKFTFNDTFKDMVRTPGQPLNFTQLIISGTMAGLFQTSVTYPLETVRTRLTLGSGLGVQYNGIMDVFRTTVRTEGIAGLYKGIGPTFLSGSPYVGLQMTFYEIFQRNAPNTENQPALTQLIKLVSGAMAGLIAQTVTYPGDTIRRRMQTNGMKGEARTYTTSWDCFQKIVKYEGYAALFNGLTANLIRALPGAAIQFWAYDLLKSLLKC